MRENSNERPAAASGVFVVGGDLPVSRLGFGAMRLTGNGVWGPPADKDAAIAVTVQNHYNLEKPQSVGMDVQQSNAMIDLCARQGIGFLPWHPQWVGELARPGSVLDQVARRHHARPGQIALAWLLQRSPTILPIPGTSSVEHLEENVESAKIKLSQGEFEEIRRVAHA
jgi:aryl-alcohol dehydrogenase-like predicted oxidoreductase